MILNEMGKFNVIYWSVLIILHLSINVSCAPTELFVLDDDFFTHKGAFSPRVRLRRQTHPAATIAKLASHDSSAFIPIIGPTQSQLSQQNSPFANPNDLFPGNDFPSLQNVPNTLVDYLVPPSPNSPTSTLNFQDPAANLHNLQNNIDNFEITPSPTPASTTNPNNFEQFHDRFQAGNNIQNHLNSLQHLQTTPSTFNNEQVQSVAFQNPSSISLTTSGQSQPSNSLSSTHGSTGQAFSNKISNSGSFSRDSFTPINNGNHFHSSQFSITTSAPSIPSLTKNEHDKTHQQPTSGKWELGFDANEILSPPREDSFGRVGEYDTINVNKFRRPSTNLNPPVPSNNEAPSNQNHLSPNQFSTSQNGIHQFNQFSGSVGGSHNDLFTPISGNHQQHFSSNKENTAEQNNVVWGSQKQSVSYNPTTNAPFLPTVPPSTPSTQHLSSFQSVNQPPSSVSQNFHNNAFNSPPQQLQQLQFTQPPPPPRDQFFEFNQNFPIDTPLTSQLDSFLPQGTVADHTYQPYYENGQHFVRKRHWNGEDKLENLGMRKSPQSDKTVAGIYERHGRRIPTHSPRLIGKPANVGQKGNGYTLEKRQWNEDVNSDDGSPTVEEKSIESDKHILKKRDVGKLNGNEELGQDGQMNQESGQHILEKRQWNGEYPPGGFDTGRQLEEDGQLSQENDPQIREKRQWNGEYPPGGFETGRQLEQDVQLSREIDPQIREKREWNGEYPPGGFEMERNSGEDGDVNQKAGQHTHKKRQSNGETKNEKKVDEVQSTFKAQQGNTDTPRHTHIISPFVERRQWMGQDNAEEHEEDDEPQSDYFSPLGVKRPVYSFVKTDRDGHFKWSVRHPTKR